VNRREKILAIAVGSILVLLGSVFGVRAVLLKPLREIDKKTAALREKLEKVKAERRAYFAAEDLVKKVAERTFADQADQASAKCGELLSRQILSSGLREGDFTRLPASPRKLAGAMEVGWSIQGEGKLEHVIDLLFMAQESPYLHRIENLVLTPGESPGKVRVRFRFLTLVLEPAPAIDRVATLPQLSLDNPKRRLFDSIVARDILRPYIKRQPGTPTPAAPTQALPGPESFRVVSLSEWMGQPEVHVRDLTNEKTARYKPGDTLAGGSIVMVDYRPLPMPGNEALKSFSRVILKIDSEYWAIERGRTLADKYKLTQESLPATLARSSDEIPSR